VIRGGSTVVSKRVERVTLDFADGQTRASATAKGGAVINRAAATLPEDVRRKLTKKRKAEDADASIDPLSAPDIRAAVARASFELLIGFQLSADQLQYNATR
jgi:multidrug efflux pump subunit AcrB